MNKLKVNTSPGVEVVFSNYPRFVRRRMNDLRKLVLETARETEGLDLLEETLKWGEPSYVTKQGSTVRMDWKEKHPDRYALYFKCTSRLVETFRKVYRGKFKFEANRAIIFPIDEPIPQHDIKECIRAALIYHRVKHLPTLGLQNRIS